MSDENENANAAANETANEAASAYSIVAFRFDGQDTAKENMRQIRLTGALDTFVVEARAIVEQDENGKIRVHEPGHGVFGAAGGAAVGGLLGMLGGPVGLLVLGALGGAVGGAVGRHWGRALPIQNLEALGEYLVPDSSAFLFLLEEVEADRLIDSLDNYGGTVVKLTVDEALSAEISEYNIVRSEDA